MIDERSHTVEGTTGHVVMDAHAKLVTIQTMTARLRLDRDTILKMSEKLWLLTIIETIGNFHDKNQKLMFSASTSDLTTEPRYTWWKGVTILTVLKLTKKCLFWPVNNAFFRSYDNVSKLKYSMNQLTRSYGRSSSPPPPDHRTRQECLGIFRELTLNEPEMVFQQKFDSHSNEKVEGAFWSGVFYKEVELYR